MTVDLISRRRFTVLVGGTAVAWPLAAHAQSGRIRRIGFLGKSTAALEATLVEAFQNGLRTLGYEEGRNLKIEYRWAEDNYDRLPKLASELVAQKVEVIVTAGTPAAFAVKRATSSVPLVMIAVGDPQVTGLVQNLGRPGGNITGFSSIAPDLEQRRLEMMRELVPNVHHIALLWNSTDPFHKAGLQQAQEAALTLRIKILPIDIKTPDEVDEALKIVLKEQADAMMILADPLFLHVRGTLMEFAAGNRLPCMSPYREMVEDGGLISYGPSYEDMHRRAAEYVDRILKGAKPSEMPVERPARFSLAINIRAAQLLGLTMPDSWVLRADKVIE